MVQTPELYQLLDYTPLFDNLRFESFIDRHYGSKVRLRRNSFFSKNASSCNRESFSKAEWDDRQIQKQKSEETVDLMQESINDIFNEKVPSRELDSESDFEGPDFGLHGFDEESQHLKQKPKPEKPSIQKLALRFVDSHEGINYLEVEKYMEAVMGLLGEIRFDEFPELVSVHDFTISSEEEEDITSKEKGSQNSEKRSLDHLEINRRKMETLEFKIKDELNDLMENASLTNILMDLNEIQNKFIFQEKSKLNFLNTLIYSLDFSELMSFCLLYTSPSPRDLSTSRMPSSA